jgi:hypothetical protein
MPFPIVPAPSTATVFMEPIDTDQASETEYSMEVRKPKDARGTNQGQAARDLGPDSVSDYQTIRASESVSEQAMAFFMSNGCTVVWGMDLKWNFL